MYRSLTFEKKESKSAADVVKCTDVDYATGSFCSSCSIPPPITGGLWSTGKGCAMCDYGCDDNYGGWFGFFLGCFLLIFYHIAAKTKILVLVYTSLYSHHPQKKRRRALRALFPAKSLKLRGLFLANKSKEASTCRREAAALAVRCLPRAQS